MVRQNARLLWLGSGRTARAATYVRFPGLRLCLPNVRHGSKADIDEPVQARDLLLLFVRPLRQRRASRSLGVFTGAPVP